MQTKTLRLSASDIAKAKLFPKFKKKLELLYGRTEKDIDNLMRSTLRKLNYSKKKRRKRSRGGHDSVFVLGGYAVNRTTSNLFRK